MGERSEVLAAPPQPAAASRAAAVASSAPRPVPVGARLSQTGVLRERAQHIHLAARDDAAAGEAVQKPDVCKQLCAHKAVCRSTLGYLACVPHLCCCPVSN